VSDQPEEIIFHINPCYPWHCGEVGAADITTTNEKDVSCPKCSERNRGESSAQPIRLCDHRPPDDPLADFYRKIRDTARLTEGITLAERIAVLDVVRAELVASFQSQIDDV
jgi:hypothetical protein